MICLNCNARMTLTGIIRCKNCIRCEYACECGFTDVAFERIRPAAITTPAKRKQRRTMKQRRLDALRTRRWKIVSAMRRHGLLGEAKSA